MVSPAFGICGPSTNHWRNYDSRVDRDARYGLWRRAVQRALGWVPAEPGDEAPDSKERVGPVPWQAKIILPCIFAALAALAYQHRLRS